ncbi:MAG: hypothetical protein U0840_17785 [Gemmataceae bacterium]
MMPRLRKTLQRLELETLEARLALSSAAVVELVPQPDGPQQTLRIDLNQHPAGNDGRPDQLLIHHDSGQITVTLVSRSPELLYQGDEAALAGVELHGSSDGETVIVQGGDALPLLYDGKGGFDHLVHLDQPVPVDLDDPVDPPLTDDVSDEGMLLPTAVNDEIFQNQPAPLMADSTSTLEVEDLAFLSPEWWRDDEPLLTYTLPQETQADDNDEQPTMPPELLGGRPEEVRILIRTPSGGGDSQPALVEKIFELAPPAEDGAVEEPAPTPTEDATEEIASPD